MAATSARPDRRRARRGSLERPVNGRMYRGTWLLVGVPLLIASFTLARAPALPPPNLPPVFDESAAHQLATGFAGAYPDRSPGSAGSLGATNWVRERLEVYGFETTIDEFEQQIPGRGRVRLRNLWAVASGRSPDAIVVMAHRDGPGIGPDVTDNASGTAALIELARAYGRVPTASGAETGVYPSYTLVFLSTDGGAFGGLGAARFAARSPYRARIAAVVNLDAIGAAGPPRIELAADEPRSPPAALVETASARVVEHSGLRLRRPSALRQLVDLGFPFSLHEQAPFVARGVPAITLTTARERPEPSFADTIERLDRERLGEMGAAAQAILGSLDQGLELSSGTGSRVFFRTRSMPGWAVQLVLIAALVPFLAAAVDLFARCRRRRIPLSPALRSYRSRLGYWLFVGALFALFAVVGLWPKGAARPLSPSSEAASEWPLFGVGGLAFLALLSWIVARERLLPRRRAEAEEELAGYTAALLALGVLGLLIVATNAFALIFLLPSLHAWLWLPQVRARPAWAQLGVLALGFAGPLLLLGSFGIRFGLGLDAPWYIAELAAVGYVPVPAIVIGLAWLAASGQLAALTVGRYAPYPEADERPERGPVRALVRSVVLAVRDRRKTSESDAEALEG